MLFEITHTTRYNYASPVARGLNEVHLTPRVLPLQSVRESVIQVDPAPAFLHHRTDYFGNEVSTFAVIERHERLTTTAKSLVEVRDGADEIQSALSWEDARKLIAETADESCLAASEFIYHSPYVPAFAELAAFARETFEAERPLLDAAKELSHRIYKEFKYDPKSTSIDMPLAEVLKNRHGVCQDFAHLMIGALRSLRLAARYVSGYVRSGANVQGAQASHAWVSVFVPGTGWLNFDPTNDVMPTDNHVTLAWGRDYGDVTPVKGVTLGGGGQTVEVEVYVKPL
ncbi:MAG TPA: transglutaminase family protein [Terriglobia bacterium]|nr:transglutaminase family protein [Terriglobia bacterium]